MMFNSNIYSKSGKFFTLMLAAICLNLTLANPAKGNNYLVAEGENIETTSEDNLAEIKIFCSTVLDSQKLQEILPNLIVETELQTIETCPDREAVLILKFDSKEEVIAKREAIQQAITQFYIDNGYINSRAKTYGARDILVDEGQAQVIVTGTTRLQNYVLDRITPAANPFNSKDIEDRLRLLKADPLIENIEATLKPNEKTKISELMVNVTEAKSFFGSVGFDNYSPPSVGGEKLNFTLGYRNLTGLADTFAIAYSPRLEDFDDTYSLGVNYQVPLNSMNGTIDLGVSLERNKIVNNNADVLNITGEAETYSISYRQPLIRTPREELALSAGFTYRDGQTFLFQNGFPFGIGPDEDGVSRTSVFNLGQEYTLRETSGAWGFRSLFRVGVDIFNATDNEVPDENGDEPPDGQFFSWLAQIQRLQVLNDDNFLIIQGDLQLTPHSLLPSEQFTVGGGQSVRGYRQNARSGDNGFRFSLEDRITIAKNEAQEPVFVAAPFFNMGVVWNVDDNPNKVPDDNFIAALGLGLLWQPAEGLNMRLDYAPPLIDIDDRGDNVQDDGLHFSLGYNF